MSPVKPTYNHLYAYIVLPQTNFLASGPWLVGVHLEPIAHRSFRGREIHLRITELGYRSAGSISDSPANHHRGQGIFRMAPRGDLSAARFWIVVYGLIALFALIGLMCEGFGYLLYLTVPGLPVFAWHVWLVSKREERRQVNVEIIATGVLSLAAPAVYWVGIGRYDPVGWWLWILILMQNAASIVYAYLRLQQGEQTEGRERGDSWKIGFVLLCTHPSISSQQRSLGWLPFYRVLYSSHTWYNGVKRCGESSILRSDGSLRVLASAN